MSFKIIVGIGALVVLVSTSGAAVGAEVNCSARQQLLSGDDEPLPRSYEDLLTYRSEVRPIVYSRLDPVQRSAVWTAHLERYITDHPELTTDQTAVLYEALDLVSDPTVFAASPTDEAWDSVAGERVRSLEGRIREAFSQEVARSIFASLGDSPEPTGLVPLKRAIGAASVIPVCSCSTASDWCGLNKHCLVSTCERQSSGCGTLWVYTCNGLCYIK